MDIKYINHRSELKVQGSQKKLWLRFGYKLYSLILSQIIGRIGLVAVLLFFTVCGEKQIQEKLDQEIPKITLERFSLTETQRGEKLWTLEAEHAKVYDEIVKVDSVKIKFYDKEQLVFSILHAPGGILNTKTHNILVGDSVAVYTNDSTKLYTDSLFWHNDSQKILTNRHVTIIKQDSTVIEGDGLRADPHLKRIEIIGKTTGVSPIKLPEIK